MIVSCSKCDSKYSVDDLKVEGKRFGFTCPKCGENVEIDNRIKIKESEEQLNEELFDESAEMMTGEENQDTDINDNLPDTDSAIDDAESTDFEEDILKEVDGLGPIGSEIEDDISISGSADDNEPDLDIENIELPDESSGGISGGISESSDEDMDDSLSLDDMELPDLEKLADISETGDTADDAMNISGHGILEDGEDLEIEETSDDFEEIDISSGDVSESQDGSTDEPEFKSLKDETESNLLDDFSPIEEDIEEVPGEESLSDSFDDEKIDLNAKDMIGLEDVKADDIFSGNNNNSEDEDEDITIDLDSLDIQLEEDSDEAGIAEDMEIEEITDTSGPLMSESLEIEDLGSEVSEDLEESFDIENELPEISEEKEPSVVEAHEEDEDITLDLDALDLTLDEVEELKEGEVLGDEERLSLSDAGLTPDELVEKEAGQPEGDASDEDIRISIDEVAPEVDIDKKSETEEDHFEAFDKDELPDIDIEEFDDRETGIETMDIEPLPEDYEDEGIPVRKDFDDHETELSSIDIDIRDTVPRGIINFSIDYSFNFSRLGGLFRLICLYPIVLIPHFIVLTLYSVLSTLLSFFNYIIILFSGVHEEDFTAVQENTIRYFLSLAACAADVVEDMPKFAGRKDIDYPLQMDATYPIRRSRILAFLRLTVVGILIAASPHLILLLVLSFGSMLIYLIGLISVIIRKKWPKILFDFIIKYYKYWASVLSYTTGVIDMYPSFKFE